MMWASGAACAIYELRHKERFVVAPDFRLLFSPAGRASPGV